MNRVDGVVEAVERHVDRGRVTTDAAALEERDLVAGVEQTPRRDHPGDPDPTTAARKVDQVPAVRPRYAALTLGDRPDVPHEAEHAEELEHV